MDVLLFSEIRIHALRDRDLAVPFLAQDDHIVAAIEKLIGDIVARTGLQLSVPAEQAARLLLLTWEGETTRAVMAAETREVAQRRVKAAVGALVPLLTV
jgi:hypothetical protein